jgi:hypothetical protein
MHYCLDCDCAPCICRSLESWRHKEDDADVEPHGDEALAAYLAHNHRQAPHAPPAQVTKRTTLATCPVCLTLLTIQGEVPIAETPRDGGSTRRLYEYDVWLSKETYSEIRKQLIATGWQATLGREREYIQLGDVRFRALADIRWQPIANRKPVDPGESP